MIVTNGKELSSALLGIEKKLKTDYEKFLRQLSFLAWNELIDRTAKDTGFARSNWDVVYNGNAKNELLKNPTKNKNSFSDSHSFLINNVKYNSKITFYNNTEYIVYLENGTENIRAQPMIEPTYQMIYNIAGTLAKQLSTKKYV